MTEITLPAKTGKPVDLEIGSLEVPGMPGHTHSWGFPTLDALSGGLRKGSLTLIRDQGMNIDQLLHAFLINFTINKNLRTALVVPGNHSFNEPIVPELTNLLIGRDPSEYLDRANPGVRKAYFKARGKIKRSKLSIHHNFLTIEELEKHLDKLENRESREEIPEVILVFSPDKFETEREVNNRNVTYAALLAHLKAFTVKTSTAVILLESCISGPQGANLKHVDTLIEILYLPWEILVKYGGPKPKEEHFFELNMSINSHGPTGNAPIRFIIDEYGMREGPWDWGKESLISFESKNQD